MSGDAEAYADVPYPGLAIPQTHPDRLAVLGVLHGLEPAAPDAARVLEIGCADGMNLVAMAAHVPGLEAVGFDLVDPVLGREAADALGLDAVRLEQADLRDARDWGEFGYVIAHGIYAWVPGDVREALMALVARSLAPQGIAFVSFNALPGARLRTMVREIALLHAGEAAGTRARVERARELYGFLAPWAQERGDAYGQVLASELARLRSLSTAVLAHDDLGERYEPVWLRDLVRHAGRHGLRYLGDAEHSELYADRRPPGVDAQLDALAGGDRLVWEQYADILAGRQFRQTLLCRADAPVDDAIEPARLAALWFAASDDAEPGGNGSAGPGATALLVARRPQALSCAELRELVPTDDVEGLCRELWHGVRQGHVELRAAAPRAASAAGLRPEASALARWQAARGPELTSLRHDAVRLDDPFGRFLVGLCDGTRERPALVDGLVAAVGRELTLTSGGTAVADGELLRPQIAAGLEHNLALLARLGLLVR